jgi:hypothetical protein
MGQTNKKELSVSTIGTIVIILIAIFPLTQIILLTLNGGLTYIFAIPFGATTKSDVTGVTSIIVNSILTILGLVMFYRADKTWTRLLSVFLIMFSGQMLMLFTSVGFNGGDNYLLGWLTVSGVPILTILATGLLRYYIKDKQLMERVS